MTAWAVAIVATLAMGRSWDFDESERIDQDMAADAATTEALSGIATPAVPDHSGGFEASPAMSWAKKGKASRRSQGGGRGAAGLEPGAPSAFPSESQVGNTVSFDAGGARTAARRRPTRPAGDAHAAVTADEPGSQVLPTASEPPLRKTKKVQRAAQPKPKPKHKATRRDGKHRRTAKSSHR